VAFTQELSLLLGIFLVSATLFGVPSDESNFTVDEYGKRHYVLVPENTNTGFLEKLSTIVSGRYSSEHKIFDYDDLTVDSESLLLLPLVSSLLFFELEPDGTPKSVAEKRKKPKSRVHSLFFKSIEVFIQIN